MNKERLQDIKKKYNYERLGEFIDVKPVNTYELRWLIEQAERVQELEQQNKHYREAIEDIKNVWKVTDTHQEYMDTVHDIIKDLEGEE